MAVEARMSMNRSARSSIRGLYRVVEHWANLPEGRVWGQAIGVDIDRDGTSIWGLRSVRGLDL
jgi:hypothetical protein